MALKQVNCTSFFDVWAFMFFVCLIMYLSGCVVAEKHDTKGLDRFIEGL